MKNIIIIGANQGIGKGLLDIYSQNPDTNVIATSRHFTNQLVNTQRLWKVQCDLNAEKSIQNFHSQISNQFKSIDGIINCAGLLHTHDFMPEKSISQLNAQQLLENYQTNAMGHLLLLKTMEKNLAAAENPFAISVSARIGSIKDNHLGGWYSYRMSKAALNMGIKTLSIEWKRKYPKIKLLLIHPGTTDTYLSQPFQKRLKAGQLHSIEQTAQYINKQINNKLQGQLEHLFVDFKGLPIEW
ncbi:MAG: SDR family NAD(P)-dependent oxidoreductase [Marinicellaceae bacterium]